jgi:hypothetical protein
VLSCCILSCCVLGCGGRQPAAELGQAPKTRAQLGLPDVSAEQLVPLAAFAGIPDRTQRSHALFVEASRVLLHPRCVNCHVEGDVPAQGARFEPHEPPVVRGSDDRGVVGMECGSCHQDRNLELARVPGAPDWRLPPRSMAWVGRSERELCEQLKDPTRNGQRSLGDIVSHTDHDAFVGWGWQPGADRSAAPGTQSEFAAIMAAWVASGAECPPGKSGGER